MSELDYLWARVSFSTFEHSSHAVAADEPQVFIDVIKGFVTYHPRARR